MTEQEWNTKLYEKMAAEQDKFREKLLAHPPEKILDRAYEYSVREDILLSLENHDLSEQQCKVLLKKASPLAKAFAEFEKRDTGYMDVVRDSLESIANVMILAEAAKKSRGDAR